MAIVTDACCRLGSATDPAAATKDANAGSLAELLPPATAACNAEGRLPRGESAPSSVELDDGGGQSNPCLSTMLLLLLALHVFPKSLATWLSHWAFSAVTSESQSLARRVEGNEFAGVSIEYCRRTGSECRRGRVESNSGPPSLSAAKLGVICGVCVFPG